MRRVFRSALTGGGSAGEGQTDRAIGEVAAGEAGFRHPAERVRRPAPQMSFEIGL